MCFFIRKSVTPKLINPILPPIYALQIGLTNILSLSVWYYETVNNNLPSGGRSAINSGVKSSGSRGVVNSSTLRARDSGRGATAVSYTHLAGMNSGCCGL